MTCSCKSSCSCSDTVIKQIVDDAVAEQAEKFSDLTQQSQTAATDADNSAHEAAVSAQQAASSANVAGSNATAASASANQAANSAAAAATSATSALNTATSLNQTAEELADTASRLSTKVDTANQSAETAETAAAQAKVNAADALTSATNAGQAAATAAAASSQATAVLTSVNSVASNVTSQATQVAAQTQQTVDYAAAVAANAAAVAANLTQSQLISQEVTNNAGIASDSAAAAKNYAQLTEALYEAAGSGIVDYSTESVLLASRPTASSQVGRAVDTGRLYYWVNAAWINLGITLNDWVKDLGNIHTALNSSTALVWTDANNVSRKTWHAMEVDVQKAITDYLHYSGIPAYNNYTEISALTPTTNTLVLDASTGIMYYYTTANGWKPAKSVDDYTAAVAYTNTQLVPIRSGLAPLNQFTGNGASAPDGIIPLYTDSDLNVLIGYDTVQDSVYVLGSASAADINLISNSLFTTGLRKYSGSDVAPIATDANNKLLLWYDPTEDAVKGVGLTASAADAKVLGRKSAGIPHNFGFNYLSYTINHLLAYGQSLSTGVRAGAVLSATQPYSNLTFTGGVRGTGGDFSGVKPLIEDATYPTPDNESTVGETTCAGSANYAVMRAYKDNGISPSSFKVFASTAGHGGYTIDQLSKGSAWYNSQLLNHVNGSVVANGQGNVAINAIAWIQGESDRGSTTAAYKTKLIKLRNDLETDIRAATGQDSPLIFLCYQHSSYAKSNFVTQPAFLEVQNENDKFYMITPLYHLLHNADGVHLDAQAYKQLGAYMGRAYKELMVDGIKPRRLRPLRSTFAANYVDVVFEVPYAPLVLDKIGMADTQDWGFQVTVDGSAVTVSNVEVIADDTVRITCGTMLTGAVAVSYATAYLGAGIYINGGASGNLRDSCPDTVFINNKQLPLWYPAPHFKMNASSEAI